MISFLVKLTLEKVIPKWYSFTMKGAGKMPITYEKLLKIFDEQGITSYTVRKEKLMGQESWKKIHSGGNIDTRTIANLCRYLNCQPGDIMAYVPDEQE